MDISVLLSFVFPLSIYKKRAERKFGFMGKGSDEEAIERKIGNAALGKDLEYI